MDQSSLESEGRSITYIKGDATVPQAKGTKIIAHIVNTEGKWGKGFVLAVSSRWPRPEAMYRQWHHQRDAIFDAEPGQIVMTSGRFELGQAQLVMVERGLAVVNMVAQFGTKTGSKGPPIRYDALESTLKLLSSWATSFNASVHMPRIGTGLAQGDWRIIEPLIKTALNDVPVYVYDYEP